jgi:metal-responsive CopG/Arc/MetJ family transcriptional regulator
MVVARREVLVQLDDELVADLDQLATALGTSRSDLLRRGAQAVLLAESFDEADRNVQLAYSAKPADSLVIRSARQLAARTGPAW